MTTTHKAIPCTKFGGAGNGNSYNYKCTFNNYGHQITVLCHGERDVAELYERAGQAVPAELAGPYDAYGRNTLA